MNAEQQAAVDEIKRVIAETGFTLIGTNTPEEGEAKEVYSWRASDITPEEEARIAAASAGAERPCGRESGPCCGGRCGG